MIAKKFGTFGGVFTPTLLTILGVIMYLRLGWVVGNAGLLGAWLIIIVSFVITTATALSMSSITTNIRIGAGGAYSIISHSLGLEVGGSLGIPRYISQGLAVTMYIFGFREGWLSIFPSHSPFFIDILVFIILYAIAYKSADLAIKTQYIIMGVICFSLVMIVFSSFYGSMQLPTEEALKWGTFRGSQENDFSGTSFWVVFAVFFPAATGIMAGANMSGELVDPRESIPKGTLWAIVVSFIIYMVLAYWIARSATEDELISNYYIMIERSFWPPALIAGVLGATFSSALASIIGSSRILFAMGEHGVLPQSKWLAFQDELGQPRNAMIVTGILIFITMLLRDLNAIAPLVTMFFLVTYAMLNVVVIIEQRLGLISFRPKFTINKSIPWIGLISSLFAMFIINPTVSLVSWGLMFLVYNILSRIHLKTPFEDVRSGLFTAFSEWAAKHTASISHKQERAWKPNLLLPVTNPINVMGSYSIIRDLTQPRGSITLLGITTKLNTKELSDQLDNIVQSFAKSDIFCSQSVMTTDTVAQGVNYANQAFKSAFFRPNIVFLPLNDDEQIQNDYPAIVTEASNLNLGVILFHISSHALYGKQQHIIIWIEEEDFDYITNKNAGNLDLALLIAYKLHLNWRGSIQLIAIAGDKETQHRQDIQMLNIQDLSRLPIASITSIIGNLKTEVIKNTKGDINIFILKNDASIFDIQSFVQQHEITALYIKDSNLENAYA